MAAVHAQIAEMNDRKERTNEAHLRELLSHPSFALLPSPHLLASEVIGEERAVDDRINTRGDARAVLKMAMDKNLRMHGLFSEFIQADKYDWYDDEEFTNVVNSSFTTTFDAVRDTSNLRHEELVFWYYAGHGLSPLGLGAPRPSAIPRVLEVFKGKGNRAIKGGELCLHKHGFCDLPSLLVPWEKALETQSQNAAPGVKSDKHLVIVLDSCFSGRLAGELERLYTEDLPKPKSERHLWNKNGCSVTVQAACSAEETTRGGYFTPTFLRLQEDTEHLKRLMQEWSELDTCDRERYSRQESGRQRLPSPMVATTNKDLRRKIKEDKVPAILFEVQGFTVPLFCDSAFFKYCHLESNRCHSFCCRSCCSLL